MTPMKKSTPSKHPGPSGGQMNKLHRLAQDIARHAVELALSRIHADQNGWQNILEHGDSLRKCVAKSLVIKARRLAVRNLTPLFAHDDPEDSHDPFERHGVPRA
jgi:hypothetical protein